MSMARKTRPTPKAIKSATSKPTSVELDRPDALRAAIDRLVASPDVTADKMIALLETQRDAEERAAKLAYARDMAAAQGDMEPIARSAHNASTGSMYADIAAISEAINPVRKSYGFGLSFFTLPSRAPGTICVGVEVMHRGGHIRTYEMDVPIASLSGDETTATHAYGATLTFGRRYATLMVFNIALKGEDKDGNAPKKADTISEDQVQEMIDLIESSNSDRAFILESHGLNDISEMSQKDFERAKAGLIARKQRIAREALAEAEAKARHE